jgi:hypothetical protein
VARSGHELSPVATYGDLYGRSGNCIDEVEESYGPYIVPRSGKFRGYEADLLEHSIFIELANSPSTPDGALAFVDSRGLLTRAPTLPLSEFYEAQRLIRTALEVGQAADGYGKLVKLIKDQSLGKLETRFEWKRRSAPQFFLEAHTLIQFCHLEHLQALAGQIDLHRCGRCGKFLPIHKDGRPKDYCGHACKQAAYRRRVAEQRSSSPLRN